MVSQAAATPLRIGNFSGFYGDRADAIAELLDAGVDYLTGDYLAELTMLILRKNQLAGRPGYAAGFIEQLRPVLSRIASQGVKVVCNAGGLDPGGCADEVRAMAAELGVQVRVAAITGDDLLPQLPALVAAAPHLLHNMDTGAPFTREPDEVLAANAYLGAWPIVRALALGADIVICPRVTDASLVIGPAAHHFGWAADDFDRLAGALWAGHAIECGAQVTGGNDAFFAEGPQGLPSMPVAEVFEDGTSIISASVPGRGRVSLDTVKAQLLYEVAGPLYRNPDVTGVLSAVQLDEVRPGAVHISGSVGYPPSSLAKLSICFDGGYRNTMTIGLTGGRLHEKLRWLREQVQEVLVDTDRFESLRWTVVGPHDEHHGSLADATALAIVTARSRTRDPVSRRHFTGAITQLGLSNIPGLYFVGAPTSEKRAAVQWPSLVEKARVVAQVTVDGGPPGVVAWPEVSSDEPVAPPIPQAVDPTPVEIQEPTALLPLSTLFGTRSGDKAGLANVGIWARTGTAWQWLAATLTVEAFRELVPEVAGLKVERHEFPSLLGLNFVVHGFLDEGAATSTRIDNQAKGLGEFLGSRMAPLPVHFLVDASDRRAVADAAHVLDIDTGSVITG